MDDAVREFGQDSVEAVCQHLLDLKEAGLVKFFDPMAHVNGWDAVVRINKGSEFALTVPGRDRLERASTSASSHTYNFYGSVGQFAARDLVRHAARAAGVHI